MIMNLEMPAESSSEGLFHKRLGRALFTRGWAPGVPPTMAARGAQGTGGQPPTLDYDRGHRFG